MQICFDDSFKGLRGGWLTFCSPFCVAIKTLEVKQSLNSELSIFLDLFAGIKADFEIYLPFCHRDSRRTLRSCCCCCCPKVDEVIFVKFYANSDLSTANLKPSLPSAAN